jgi:amyloid beta (A4) precursor-like protein 2
MDVSDIRREICAKPALMGPCRARLSRWRYNPIEEKCVTFVYGGCHGNENNFRTEQACMNYCKSNHSEQAEKRPSWKNVLGIV